MSEKPVVAAPNPIPVSGLEAGTTKYWCTCGKSKNQPFCDGSHKGSSFSPLAWKVPEPAGQTFYLCQCKATKNPPFCDGSHSSFK